MLSPQSSSLERLVTRARRRLFLQILGRVLTLCCPALLLLAALGIAILGRGHLRGQPWSPESEPFLTRTALLGGAVVLGLVLGCLLAWLRRPSLPSTALTLDEKFDLKQRLST